MANSPNQDTGPLVTLVRAGDKEAYTGLVERFQNAAYATALAILPVAEDARDIVQDAFVEAYCKLDQLREPERFGWWLRRIVRNRALNRLREKPTADLDDEAVRHAAVTSVVDAERRRGYEELWSAVQALPEEYREIVLMFYLRKDSYRDIAAILGLSVATVNTRLRTARAKLREKLSPAHEEEWKMSQVQVAEEVQESICQIARREIQQRVPRGATDHLVLFCGVSADIEVCHTDGEDVVLTGAATAIGLSEEQARETLESTHLLVDQVDNFLRTGPHAGEVGVGANSDSTCDPPHFEMQVRPSHHWRDRLRQQADFPVIDEMETATRGYRTWATDGLYTEMDLKERAIYQHLCQDLGRPVTRLSVMQQQTREVVLEEESFTESVRRVFHPVSQVNGYRFGASGHVDMVVAVPSSVAVTVLRADRLSVLELQSNLNVVEGRDVTLTDIEGEVHLLNTTVKRAERIRGKFIQSLTRFPGGCNLPGGLAVERTERGESVLRDLDGTVQLDLLQTDLDAVDLSGEVAIRNRFGRTRLHLSQRHASSRFRLESDSGEMRVSVKEECLQGFGVVLHSLCGRLDANSVRDELPYAATCSDNPVMSLVARANPGGPIAMVCNSRDGSITVEKAG